MNGLYPLFAFVPGSGWSVSLFVAICGWIVAMLLAAAVYCRSKPSQSDLTVFWLTSMITLYCIAIFIVVRSGWLDRYFIPLGPLFLGSSVLCAIVFGLSRYGRKLAYGVPLGYLVGCQSFRLPLEIVLHDWASTKTIPETMTWTGSNWDILSGIGALVMCGWVAKRRWLAWIFNILGICLLANVVRVAVMSSPVPFGWQLEPPLELILYLPYAFIVPLCVGGAALGHVLLTQRLLSESCK